jgi:hypothetical protein
MRHASFKAEDSFSAYLLHHTPAQACLTQAPASRLNSGIPLSSFITSALCSLRYQYQFKRRKELAQSRLATTCDQSSVSFIICLKTNIFKIDVSCFRFYFKHSLEMASEISQIHHCQSPHFQFKLVQGFCAWQLHYFYSVSAATEKLTAHAISAIWRFRQPKRGKKGLRHSRRPFCNPYLL